MIKQNIELIEKNIYFMGALMSKGMQNTIDEMDDFHKNKENRNEK